MSGTLSYGSNAAARSAIQRQNDVLCPFIVGMSLLAHNTYAMGGMPTALGGPCLSGATRHAHAKPWACHPTHVHSRHATSDPNAIPRPSPFAERPAVAASSPASAPALS